jgi:hypothetical protein
MHHPRLAVAVAALATPVIVAVVAATSLCGERSCAEYKGRESSEYLVVHDSLQFLARVVYFGLGRHVADGSMNQD